ncbi:class I adenylate-forming enzyme family protein [Halorarius halobius]|uniref:class I adenylate-forming enzyme family protein n=1 Tax=Halorarius halobius TaxID=2962671 RepID=UPI0020CD7869|nr:class I adenylate-forming enzyme family protein [Halorarius halobius]
MNLYEQFRRHVDRAPGAPALVDPDGEDVTYAALDERAGAVAATLAERTDPGDRVAVYMLDNDTYVACVLGALRAGCAVTPVNYRFDTEGVRGVLEDVRPTVLLTDDVYRNTAHDVAADVDAIETVIEAHEGGFVADAVGDPGAAPAPVTRLDDDVAVVMHTSGTTGTPKGVVQTHRTVGAQIDAGAARYGITPDDTAVVAVPLFHVGGLHCATMMALTNGASLVVQPAWNAAEWARLVEATDATYSGLIPAMIRDLLDTEAARERDTSSIDFCLYGGSPTPEALLQEFEEAFDLGGLYDFYGQTEASGVSVTYGAGWERRPGMMGTVVESLEWRVVEIGSGEPLPAGQQGELQLRGDSIMDRYWELPERTEEAFDDGWFRTGDVVVADDDGYISYVDRLDDIILSGGEKVAPAAVEDALQEWNRVQGVAVFGTPHERLGEAVTAAVIGEDDLTTEEVAAYCDDHGGLAGYETPRRVVFVDEFPRTGSQKVDKVALRERVAD